MFPKLTKPLRNLREIVKIPFYLRKIILKKLPIFTIFYHFSPEFFIFYVNLRKKYLKKKVGEIFL
jgi:hypothetical protein